MKKEKATITIKNHREEVVLSTDSDNYMKDLLKSKNEILNNIVFTCFVEYHMAGQENLRAEAHPDSRRVIVLNGKTINASWNINFGYRMSEADFNDLVKFVKEDVA